MWCSPRDAPKSGLFGSVKGHITQLADWRESEHRVGLVVLFRKGELIGLGRSVSQSRRKKCLGRISLEPGLLSHYFSLMDSPHISRCQTGAVDGKIAGISTTFENILVNLPSAEKNTMT
jgi:hypothetical protein